MDIERVVAVKRAEYRAMLGPFALMLLVFGVVLVLAAV